MNTVHPKTAKFSIIKGLNEARYCVSDDAADKRLWHIGINVRYGAGVWGRRTGCVVWGLSSNIIFDVINEKMSTFYVFML